MGWVARGYGGGAGQREGGERAEWVEDRPRREWDQRKPKPGLFVSVPAKLSRLELYCPLILRRLPACSYPEVAVWCSCSGAG